MSLADPGPVRCPQLSGPPRPQGLEGDADSQVWRLDDGEWHAEPLRPAPSPDPETDPNEE